MRCRLYDKDKYSANDGPLGEVIIPLTDVASDLNMGSSPKRKEQARHRLKKLQGGMKLAVAKEQWGTLGRIEDRDEEEDEEEGDDENDDHDTGKNGAVGGKAELKDERQGADSPTLSKSPWKPRAPYMSHFPT